MAKWTALESFGPMHTNAFPYWLNQFELRIVLFALKGILSDASFYNLPLSNNKTMEIIIGEQKEASG